jgi:hypothetical protein
MYNALFLDDQYWSESFFPCGYMLVLERLLSVLRCLPASNRDNDLSRWALSFKY